MTPAEEITRKMGGKWRGGAGGYGMIRCPAHEDGYPSCRVRNGDNGRPLVSCYSGCDRTAIIDALKRLGAWPEAAASWCERRERPQRHYAECTPAPPPRDALSDEGEQHVAFARAIWAATVEPHGTPAERYWREARGLTLPIPSAIRFGPAVPYGYARAGRPPPRRLPAMVAMVRAVDGSFAGVHCTFLEGDGSAKRGDVPKSRLVFGSVGGCAIWLSDAADELALGEGIESTASWMQETGAAGWAAMNTGGLRSIVLPPPPLAFAVTLLGENDANGASEKAILEAKARLRLEGRMIEAVYPAFDLKDFNEFHRRSA